MKTKYRALNCATNVCPDLWEYSATECVRPAKHNIETRDQTALSYRRVGFEADPFGRSCPHSTMTMDAVGGVLSVVPTVRIHACS